MNPSSETRYDIYIYGINLTNSIFEGVREPFVEDTTRYVYIYTNSSIDTILKGVREPVVEGITRYN